MLLFIWLLLLFSGNLLIVSKMENILLLGGAVIDSYVRLCLSHKFVLIQVNGQMIRNFKYTWQS